MDFSKTVGKVITCKAVVAKEVKGSFSVETIQVGTPCPGEVRIKIVACGLCHSDLSCIEGYFPDNPFPYVAGHEGSGIVESVGEGVTSVKQGDKVMTLFLANCRQCPECKTRATNVCGDYGRKVRPPFGNYLRTKGYDNTTRFSCNGTPLFYSFGASCFSEYTVIPENSCVKVDPRTVLEKACIMACGFPTGYGSTYNAVSLKPDDIVAVWGMGGVGLSAVVGCKKRGVKRIIGIDVNPDKEAMARQMGCTDFVSLATLDKPLPEVIVGMTNGGLNYAVVCVGNAKAMETAVYCTRPGGTTVLVGVAHAEDIINLSPLFLLSNRKIMATIIGEYKILDDLPPLVKKYVDGQLPEVDELVTHTLKMEQIQEAVDLLKSGKSIRIVLIP